MIEQFSEPAYRYHDGKLSPAVLPGDISRNSLLGLDREQTLIKRNIERFLAGKPALNVLLWGEKGAGKSTIVRMLASEYARRNLRVIEYCDNDFYGIYELYHIIRKHSTYRFVIYFDDVSFDDSDERYRKFKSIVEGGLEEKPANSLFIATSNRRHFIAEKAMDTQDIYNRDIINEQSSLHARFGLTLGFYPLERTLYLEIVGYYMEKNGIPHFDGWEETAEAYAMQRGGRSGRAAQQFCIYYQITEGE